MPPGLALHGVQLARLRGLVPPLNAAVQSGMPGAMNPPTPACAAAARHQLGVVHVTRSLPACRGGWPSLGKVYQVTCRPFPGALLETVRTFPEGV